MNITVCFDCLHTFFFSNNILAECCHSCTQVFMGTAGYACHVVMKTEFFSREIFENWSNFMKICSEGAMLLHADGRTDKPLFAIVQTGFTFLKEVCGQTGRDSSVGIATRYGLDGPGIESRWGARFSAPVQTGPGVHPASYTMGTESLPGVKRPGRGVDHPPTHI